MPEFITAATEDDFQRARRLLRGYEDFVEVDLCFAGFEEELRNLERVYGPPGGTFLLLRQEGQTEGCVAMRLDTLPIMRAAIDLYRSMGFYEIDAYAENPVKGALCMELELKPT